MRRSLTFGIHLLLFACLTCPAVDGETLQELLDKSGVPVRSFTAEELSAEVNRAIHSDDKRVLIAYGPVDRLTGIAFIGARSTIRFDRPTGSVLRGVLPENQTSRCGGAPEAISITDDFVLVTTHINPSAGCTLVLDDQMHLQKTLFGFSPVRVAPGKIVIVENMIHFAAVHPERLQLIDLETWVISELYPPRGDAMRHRLAAMNAAKMPPQATCVALNEDCDADLFDESVSALTSDNQGRFAFIVTQAADHVLKQGEQPETVASQTVFYLYQRRGSGWRFCQEELQDSEVEPLTQALQSDFAKAGSRCTPKQVVFPDLKTQKYNPSVTH
jgi:hypothetical protein